MNKLPVAAGLALALVAGSAFAADLPSRKGPPAYIPPAFSWTGLYGGINIGYGFGAGGADRGSLLYPFGVAGAWNGSQNLNGVLGGGQAGYNYQFNPWLVLGVEADIQAADVRSNNNVIGAGANQLISVNSTKSVDWFGTVRARVGVTLPGWSNVLVYGTGGFAYGQVDHTVGVLDMFTAATAPAAAGQTNTGRAKSFTTQAGWTAGGGVEWTPMAFPAWSVKVEYLYTDLGSTTLSMAGFTQVPAFVPPWIGTHNSNTRFHTVRAGLNWHFNPFASGAVLAKY